MAAIIKICHKELAKSWRQTLSIYIEEEERHRSNEAEIGSIGRLKIVEHAGCWMSRVSSYFSRSLETQYLQILHHSSDTLKYDTKYLQFTYFVP